MAESIGNTQINLRTLIQITMENPKFNHGSVNWLDVTVENAEELKNFYQKITNWNVDKIPMKDKDGEYFDFMMKSEEGNPIAGICHHRGTNVGIPPTWIMYISVENVQQAVEEAIRSGAKILKQQTHKDGNLYYSILQDPAGIPFGLARTQF